MKIAVILPRGMHFGPKRATAIDLCVRDFVTFSRFREKTMIFGELVAEPFSDLSFQGVSRTNGDSQPEFVRRLMERVKAFRPDLIVVHQHLPSARIVRKMFPITPVLFHKHNTPKIGSGFFRKTFEARRYGAFDHLIFVSDFSRKRFLDVLPGLAANSSTVHNGLDLSEWAPAQERRKTVLFTGRAVPEKGVLEAARAVVATLARHQDWQARFILSTLATNSAYVDEISAILTPLGERLELYFDQPHSIVRQAFETAAIALVPSQFEEPFGRTAIEAMAGGAALVTSLKGGLREIAEGVSVNIDPSDLGNFTEELSRLMADEGLRQQLAASAAKRVAERFSIQTLSARLDSLYEDVLSRHRIKGK